MLGAPNELRPCPWGSCSKGHLHRAADERRQAACSASAVAGLPALSGSLEQLPGNAT